MNNKGCDLHIHSNFSDSDADLETIFKQAKEKGLACIAVTDHDTLEGMKLARTYSKSYGVELIEGLELSAEHKGAEVHILAYFVDSENEELKSELAQIKELRVNRLLWMAEKLNSLGVEVNIEELFSKIKGAIPTRLHLALYLLEKGKVKTLRQAFQKYLSPGKPAYRSRFKYSVEEAIQLIRKFGGLSFIAHPHVIPDQSWIEEFISLGVDGLETIYPTMSPVKRLLYKEMAIKFKKLQSGGSDAHGSYKEFIKIGEVDIPYAWVEDMKRCLEIEKC
ncbi:MAG: PHP domain-containing protein [Candidatus Omnitrophica bacterium]|nr:PHP domain-containing protein [Candidatus Omnitrophota bacterium]